MQIEGKPVTRQMFETAQASRYTDKKRSCRMIPVTFSKFCTKNERVAPCGVGCLPIAPALKDGWRSRRAHLGLPVLLPRQIQEPREETALKTTEMPGPRTNSQRKLRKHELPGSWIAPQDTRPGSCDPAGRGKTVPRSHHRPRPPEGRERVAPLCPV